MQDSIDNLIKRMLSGEKAALSCLISLVEEGSLDEPKVLDKLSSHLGRAYRIGITGSAGCGKSTLIDSLTAVMRTKGLRVGIIAVDPSSSISGGAFLGDRLRMSQHYLDDGVFIRSMATRGNHGGLSRAVPTTLDLLDAFGEDIILIETVGAGQTQVDINEVADVTVLVLTPESGDSIQFMKAGLAEIADVIVVNKADLGGVERIVAAFNGLLNVSHRKTKQSIIVCQALNNRGIEELYQELIKRRGDKNQHRSAGWRDSKEGD
jgi:LAO/AO transport system kinase